MVKTLIEIDEEALATAAAVLGTKTTKDTVNAALREAGQHPARLHALARLGERRRWPVGSQPFPQDIQGRLKHVVPDCKDLPFRFVYTSGGLVPYLDSNALFFLGNARKLRVRNDLASLCT